MCSFWLSPFIPNLFFAGIVSGVSRHKPGRSALTDGERFIKTGTYIVGAEPKSFRGQIFFPFHFMSGTRGFSKGGVCAGGVLTPCIESVLSFSGIG